MVLAMTDDADVLEVLVMKEIVAEISDIGQALMSVIDALVLAAGQDTQAVVDMGGGLQRLVVRDTMTPLIETKDEDLNRQIAPRLSEAGVLVQEALTENIINAAIVARTNPTRRTKHL